jgi:hypothetical protein
MLIVSDVAEIQAMGSRCQDATQDIRRPSLYDERD